MTLPTSNLVQLATYRPPYCTKFAGAAAGAAA
jgi:hypothetical protein